ncbi:MAG: Pyridoxamine 5'-phosphate oxidase [uncultured Solirubrobacteraceae bacterium]|uniref:Pyridoxine/pyridoxamine 5'-phosphate oxidase n=1 Tax=uncultured Solirubrobacteraceae bacterium TaxID=1162706 RepID=A0A6J4SP29_9ACTN|nr:MAG: Pyridoxamine 5'-phosphate oxidase [uncultured Solirubrobacteraceae bacterium]
MTGRLAGMRRSYDLGGLDETALAATWLEQFERWLADAVAAGIPEPNAMVLATADAGGAPSARTVLLKGVGATGFVFFTNLGSRKGAQATANPRAALTFPWLEQQRQVCVTGRVEPVAGAEADTYFASRSRGAQLGAHASPQSSVVASRTELEQRFEELGRRWPEGTAVPRPPQWGGLRVAPDGVEFWQGRPNRLHDRLRFRAVGPGWVVERLAP